MASRLPTRNRESLSSVYGMRREGNLVPSSARIKSFSSVGHRIISIHSRLLRINGQHPFYRASKPYSSSMSRMKNLVIFGRKEEHIYEFRYLAGRPHRPSKPSRLTTDDLRPVPAYKTLAEHERIIVITEYLQERSFPGRQSIIEALL